MCSHRDGLLKSSHTQIVCFVGGWEEIWNLREGELIGLTACDGMSFHFMESFCLLHAFVSTNFILNFNFHTQLPPKISIQFWLSHLLFTSVNTRINGEMQNLNWCKISCFLLHSQSWDAYKIFPHSSLFWGSIYANGSTQSYAFRFNALLYRFHKSQYLQNATKYYLRDIRRNLWEGTNSIWIVILNISDISEPWHFKYQKVFSYNLKLNNISHAYLRLLFFFAF